jgi:uncharacterized NAD(P)/FAD-binding protein YdhS
MLLAAQVLRKAQHPIHVTVVEPRDHLGQGVAYSTTFLDHLLNVRAKSMSVLVEHPAHFVKWVNLDREAFAPRKLFAEYLRHVLDEARQSAAHGVNFDHVQSTVVNVDTSGVGARVGADVRCSNGQVLEADIVVLATGNGAPFVPAWVSADVASHPRFIADPWAPDALARIDGGTVVTIGTGLTFVDAAVFVLRVPQANVIGISRHGLLPTRHTHVEHPPIVPQLSTPREVLHWLRQNRGAWREAVNGLRTRTQELWMNFTDAQQRQFLRHAMRYWEIHRHRMATQIANQVDGYLTSGRMRVMKSKITGISVTSPSSLTVHIAGTHSVVGDWVVLCTGPSDADALRQAPLADLIASGRADVGPQGMGVRCDPWSGALIDAQGVVSTSMFTIGPLRRGMLWETAAIPEIHVQADQLGELISNWRI